MILLIFISAWYTMMVDPNLATGTGVAIDVNHNPHLFYYTNDTILTHAYWNNDSWVYETVAPAASWHNGGPSVVIDANNRIYVAFYAENNYLGYAYFDGTWHTEIVDNSSSCGDYCSLKLDSNGNPHIAYIAEISGCPLRYAYKNGTDWVIQERPYCAFTPSLGLDSLDHPHIAHNDPSTYTLYYTSFDGTTWTTETVYSGGAGSECDLVLDQNDLPNISFYWPYGGGNYSLGFAQKDGGIWNTYIVHQGAQPTKKGWNNQIAMTDDGVMHIASHAHNECFVEHAWGDGNSWNNEVVDTIGMYGAAIGICTDANDVFISYCDGGTGGGTVWLASTRIIGSEEQKQTVKTPNTLQCQPNPFTRFTSIPGSKDKHFSLYNITGKWVGTFPGDRIGYGLPAGIYFVVPEDRSLAPARVVKVR
ncbi:hypothetical protein BXT86_00680 [candidate division WOR-3 bacterium 4484_100]|uniref:Uncharacterized protein n=1 Tax=candidate division WOR-3 bacterium 4484_100 TaxID=1936077 RepID=A0A1V4QGQ6_UNCW3|nr:MAG: hypothetical protein BXT86_00680 [candidate division WOR-3 bacterium 4484_100]